MRDTWPRLEQIAFPAIRRGRLDTLQVNVGYRCNQSCVHCHVNAGPNRKEEMSSDDEVENRITQELQPFVVGTGRTPVSQGGDEQLRVARLIAQLLADPADGPIAAAHVRCAGI